LSKKEKKQPASPAPEAEETMTPETAAPEEPAPETQAGPSEAETLKQTIADQEDRFLRLAAEYDNFRRRTQKEKEGIYADATAAAVSALLPVYDNLERALKQETADEAYKKGVEMTMTGLLKALEGLGVKEIPAEGQSFDPNVHNAVMHIDDETLGENTVAEVFQTGFTLGEKVIRFAMVKVAN
jgi:molecular chaperone GrpE